MNEDNEWVPLQLPQWFMYECFRSHLVLFLQIIPALLPLLVANLFSL